MLKTDCLNLKKGSFELKNISLDIDKNTYFIVLGKTGAGKTILLESIAGLHKTKGNIFLNNKKIDNLPTEKRNIGFVYQDFALFPHLTVKKNIEFAKKYNKHLNKKETDELINFLNIEHILNRRIQNLSGGEKQRVALARAIFSKPSLLLLDEPLSAIDPSFRTKIMDNLKSLIEKFNLTVIHVTHNFREAAYLSDKTAIMLDGEIVQQGNIHEILTSPKNVKIAEFLGFKNILPTSFINKFDNSLNNNNFFSIEPSEIEISTNKPNLPYIFKGKITKIIEQTDHYKIYFKSSKQTFFIKKSKQEFNNNNLEINKNYFIGFSQENLHIMIGN